VNLENDLDVGVSAHGGTIINDVSFRGTKGPAPLVIGSELGGLSSLGGVASLSFVLFLAADRNVAFFKLYYIAGGLMMAAYLGLGSMYLHASRRVADITAGLVVLISALGIILILATPIDSAKLDASNVEAGQNLIGGVAVVPIILLNTFGAVAVIGGAIPDTTQPS